MKHYVSEVTLYKHVRDMISFAFLATSSYCLASFCLKFSSDHTDTLNSDAVFVLD